MQLIVVVECILLLIILISIIKINPVISFLIVSIIAGLALQIPSDKIVASIQKGMGETLGTLVFIISLGAMLGKLIAESGAGQQIANVMIAVTGPKYIQWALMFTGFIIGIPLFYGVGFVLLVPIIFSVAYNYKLPAVYIGLPMLAALSVTFGFLPPHPSPTALVFQFKANMGLTLCYGLIISIPAILLAGPLFSRTLKNLNSAPLATFQPVALSADQMPGKFSSFFTALFPVMLLMITTLFGLFHKQNDLSLKINNFIGDPVIVMLLAVLIAVYILGLNRGKSIRTVMNIFAESIKDIGMILLIIGSAGTFKQVLSDSGVSLLIGSSLQHMHLQPLFLAWLIAATIRICVGSATIAGLTTAGIILPLSVNGHVHPELMVLAIGAGSLACSHVNDSGFWLFKEYFNLSVKDTLRSWTVMESIISVAGLAGVLLLNSII